MLEEAAKSLGATPARTLRRVAIPLIGANLAAGSILAFAFAMLEVSDSLILAQQAQHFPITKAIYTLLSTLGWAMATAPNSRFEAAAAVGQSPQESGRWCLRPFLAVFRRCKRRASWEWPA
jgi:ABC-type Fe3+ transport system permease subunit